MSKSSLRSFVIFFSISAYFIEKTEVFVFLKSLEFIFINIENIYYNWKYAWLKLELVRNCLESLNFWIISIIENEKKDLKIFLSLTVNDLQSKWSMVLYYTSGTWFYLVKNVKHRWRWSTWWSEICGGLSIIKTSALIQSEHSTNAPYHALNKKNHQ